ncbi:YrzI family small protein [Neobacillus niacini]|nr:YrzI family small protein [Neobacillus niacini]MEC1521931.1 YrzI family small protein [Neobacillus niacini]
MTLTIFFFTISINKHEPTLEEAIHSEAVKDRIQESKDRYLQIMGRY